MRDCCIRVKSRPPLELNQYKITKSPSGRAIGAAKLQTGAPGAVPFTAILRLVRGTRMRRLHLIETPLRQNDRTVIL
jgi:hypothetical protein